MYIQGIKDYLDYIKEKETDAYEKGLLDAWKVFAHVQSGELSFEDIKEILEYIGSNVRFYIQNYRDCEAVLKKGLNGFSDEELLNFKEKLEKKYPNITIRGKGKR